MGRPRMIIIIRHAQSEGNRNRAIHQTIPDHRVQLTPTGHAQALEAGHRLRSMLRPDDTLQIYTSPYRRTRETTQGILASLTGESPPTASFSDSTPRSTSGNGLTNSSNNSSTANSSDGPPTTSSNKPSATTSFPRSSIKIWEEPRLREQDFGNFQPCSSAMSRMWQERADYGHFFYRIPDGESAADAYDRVSGFNETLWRSFAEEDFPSVCVLVTHGLMTRVFLMKWYHWSVERFEDLRNVGHCEFVVMDSEAGGENGEGKRRRGQFVLKSELRTWSELKKEKQEERERKAREGAPPSPEAPRKQVWGGCPEGCSHDHAELPLRAGRKPVQEVQTNNMKSTSPTISTKQSQQQPSTISVEPPSPIPVVPSRILKARRPASEEDEEAFPSNSKSFAGNSQATTGIAQQIYHSRLPRPSLHPRPDWMESGRDAGGSRSGAATPAGELSSDGEQGAGECDFTKGKSAGKDAASRSKIAPSRGLGSQDCAKEWESESGMGSGARADALGDQSEVSDEGESAEPADLDEACARDKSLRGSVYSR